ncbi:2Fe-2S iron-sulfur cluster-binding protein [Nocardia sp. R6R-6]|uniref:2Fe-2S iron-sulfur cluster-binding protein n=1 Tax=Nocardia sp. R6R-6 TaxID=3459303 RepID=UPI00403DC15A
MTARASSTGDRRVVIAGPGEKVGEQSDVLVRRHGEVVLDTLLRLGWTAPHACRRGGCGVCLIRIHRGEVRHGPHTQRALSQRAETEERLGLACRALPTTSVVEIDFCRGDTARGTTFSDSTRSFVKEQ